MCCFLGIQLIVINDVMYRDTGVERGLSDEFDLLASS